MASRREILFENGATAVRGLVVHDRRTSFIAIVGADDYVAVRSIRWFAHTRAGNGGVSARYMDGSRAVYLHRVICARNHGAPPAPEYVCRHKNGDLLDCRAENLEWKPATGRFAGATKRSKRAVASLLKPELV